MNEKKIGNWKRELIFIVSLILLFLFGAMVQHSQARTIGSFQQENYIEIISQTGILDTNLTYSFKEINNTHWIANFCVKPTTSAIFNPAKYPLINLTDGIIFERISPIRFNVTSKCGSFYIIFPKGFKPNLLAKFGENSTIIGTGTVIPFYPNQRAICRDGNNNIHSAWLYNSTAIVYANSTNNGVNWITTFLNSSTATKGTPHTSCDGNNITIFYEDTSSDDIYVYISTNNGGTFTWKNPVTSGVYGLTGAVVGERRGQNIYIAWQTSATAGMSVKFINSSDGGSTWGSQQTLFQGTWLPLIDFFDNFIKPSIIVNGTGTASDRIFILVENDGTDVGSYSYAMVMKYSTNAGNTWTALTNIASFSNSIAGHSLGYDNLPEQLFISLATSDDTHAYNSSNLGVSWTDTTILDTIGHTKNPSVALDVNNENCIFIQNDNGITNNDNIVYVNRSNGIWGSYTNVTTDFLRHQYPNTRWNYNLNGVDLVWYNGTSTIKNITYALVNCTYTAPSIGGGQPPSLEIGDPLYCSISPIVGPGISPIILCMPKNNQTGQPLTGLTINCQVQLSTSAFSGDKQPSSAMTEQTNGMYNYTIQSGNLAANTLYTANCSTAISGINNNFGMVFYVMPDFASATNISQLITMQQSANNNQTLFNQSINNTLDNLATNISSLANLTAQQVWEYSLRDANCSNCTSGNTYNYSYNYSYNSTLNSSINNSYYQNITLSPELQKDLAKGIAKVLPSYEEQLYAYTHPVLFGYVMPLPYEIMFVLGLFFVICSALGVWVGIKLSKKLGIGNRFK